MVYALRAKLQVRDLGERIAQKHGTPPYCPQFHRRRRIGNLETGAVLAETKSNLANVFSWCRMGGPILDLNDEGNPQTQHQGKGAASQTSILARSLRNLYHQSWHMLNNGQLKQEVGNNSNSEHH